MPLDQPDITPRLPKGFNQEMSFLDHLEALRWHIIRSILAMVVGMVVAFVYVSWLINEVVLWPLSADFPTLRWVCGLDAGLCPEKAKVTLQATEPSEQFTRALLVAIVSGFIAAFPYIFWEVWRFIRPGLMVAEIRKTRGVIAIVSLLFFMGVFFGYFVVTPFTLSFFSSFSLSPQVENIWRIGTVISLVVQICLAAGILFQMPVVAYFLARVGILHAAAMRRVRKHAIVGSLIVGGILTPSPDLLSQLLLAIPLLALYEVSILIVNGVELRHAHAAAATTSVEEAQGTPPPAEPEA